MRDAVPPKHTAWIMGLTPPVNHPSRTKSCHCVRWEISLLSLLSNICCFKSYRHLPGVRIVTAAYSVLDLGGDMQDPDRKGKQAGKQAARDPRHRIPRLPMPGSGPRSKDFWRHHPKIQAQALCEQQESR